MNESVKHLSDIALASFNRDGYLIVPALLADSVCERMSKVAREHLSATLAPVEFETDIQYPGAPEDRDSAGGDTVRRLLNACSRDSIFRSWATSADLRHTLAQLFGDDAIVLSQSHHNCVMTKVPGHSSATLWHQDNRYWSFDKENLISVWLALGAENHANGCLYVIPGSHELDIAPGRFDASLFLRPDLPENRRLIASARAVELARGDVLFFHSRLFHAAGRNTTSETKFSLVLTYHEASNYPISGTRSARYPGINL
ncbi:MAG: phytanoyl-CoA dioxygenase family protein [Pseudomonadales bacterium]